MHVIKQSVIFIRGSTSSLEQPMGTKLLHYCSSAVYVQPFAILVSVFVIGSTRLGFRSCTA